MCPTCCIIYIIPNICISSIIPIVTNCEIFKTGQCKILNGYNPNTICNFWYSRVITVRNLGGKSVCPFCIIVWKITSVSFSTPRVTNHNHLLRSIIRIWPSESGNERKCMTLSDSTGIFNFVITCSSCSSCHYILSLISSNYIIIKTNEVS